MGPDDRGVLIGKTGGGKTTLARFLIEDPIKPYSVVWNPKNAPSIAKWKEEQLTSLQRVKESDAHRIIYTPAPDLAEDADNQWEFFYWIYERRHTRLYIDEATSIKWHGGQVPKPLVAVLNRGRERGVSTLTATQRPSQIPMNVLSESEHYYIFKVLLPQDRQRIEAVTGLSVEEQDDLKDYQFYYFNVSRGLLPRKLILSKGVVNGSNGSATATTAANSIQAG